MMFAIHLQIESSTLFLSICRVPIVTFSLTKLCPCLSARSRRCASLATERILPKTVGFTKDREKVTVRTFIAARHAMKSSTDPSRKNSILENMPNKKKKLRPAVKTHGGKWYLSSWVIENFPSDYASLRYCEPMCAGASVFLNKEPSGEEVISDLDVGVISIYKALRDEPDEFLQRLKRIRYTEKVFTIALAKEESQFDDYIEQAINEYTLRRMSRGGTKKSFAWSDRQRGGKPGDVNAWETMIKELPELVERVKNTVILNKSVFEVFKVWDEQDTLTYLDPPYLHETRSEGAENLYKHEMTVEDHIELLNMVKSARGKVIISGYSSPLYNRNLKGWKVKKKTVANHSAQTKTKEKRVEVLWLNY
jgi:DNA adenine methylase